MSEPIEGHLYFAAEDMSAYLKPAWWRVRQVRHWKRHHQPADIYRCFVSAVRGEQEPVRQYGISIDYSTEAASVSILRQVARLVTTT